MKNNNAHLFEDPKTGILWVSDYTWDETGIVQTPEEELDLTKFKAIDAEYISYHCFGMCLSCDLFIVKNAKGMYSVLTPFHASMGNGAIFASICNGFEFKSVYGFGVIPPLQFATIYVIAENAKGKWGIIRLMASNNIWRCYLSDYMPFSIPQLIIPFEYRTMEDVLKVSGLEIPAASLVSYNPDNQGLIRDLTERNVDSSDTFGITKEDMLKARKYKEEQEASSNIIETDSGDNLFGHISQFQEDDDEETPTTTAKGKKSPAKGLRVTIPGGIVIQEKQAKDTFIRAIQIAGAYRVRDEVKITLAHRPLISDTQVAMYDHRHKTHPIPGTNLFVNTQAENKRKKLFLEQISATLELGWKVDLI